MNFNEILTKLNEAVDRFSIFRKNPDESMKSLHEQIELTQKLYDFITGEDGKPDKGRFEKISLEAEADIPIWLMDLPFNLGAHNMVDEAVKISRLYSEVFETENFLGDLAVILAEAGRKEEALKQLDENLRRFPDDVWIIIKAGHAFQKLNENEKAIELYERAYGMTMPRTYDRNGVLERLVPLSRNVGRDTEADELMKKEDKDVAEEKESSEEEKSKSSLPLRTKKIGRNEPCPCGSGMKFKKCCGK